LAGVPAPSRNASRQRDDLVVLDPTGRRQHHVRGRVVAGQEGEEVVTAICFDRVGGAQHRTAQRWPGKAVS